MNAMTEPLLFRQAINGEERELVRFETHPSHRHRCGGPDEHGSPGDRSHDEREGENGKRLEHRAPKRTVLHERTEIHQGT